MQISLILITLMVEIQSADKAPPQTSKLYKTHSLGAIETSEDHQLSS
jgi:hypothetical protein